MSRLSNSQLAFRQKTSLQSSTNSQLLTFMCGKGKVKQVFQVFTLQLRQIHARHSIQFLYCSWFKVTIYVNSIKGVIKHTNTNGGRRCPLVLRCATTQELSQIVICYPFLSLIRPPPPLGVCFQLRVGLIACCMHILVTIYFCVIFLLLFAMSFYLRLFTVEHELTQLETTVNHSRFICYLLEFQSITIP